MLKIRILDRVYEVACTPGKEAHVENLGKRLNEKVQVISGVVDGQTAEQHILVTALFLMEEVLALKAQKETQLQNPPLSQSSEGVAEAVALSADRIEAICERLEAEFDTGPKLAFL